MDLSVFKTGLPQDFTKLQLKCLFKTKILPFFESNIKGSKQIRQWSLNWCTSPMMIHKFVPSVSTIYSSWNTLASYYKTFGTSVINIKQSNYPYLTKTLSFSFLSWGEGRNPSNPSHTLYVLAMELNIIFYDKLHGRLVKKHCYLKHGD